MDKSTTLNFEHTKAAEKTVLYELTEVKADQKLPPIYRIRQFIADVSDPYHFSVSGTDVRIRFNGHQGICTRLASAMRAMDEQSATRNIPTVFTLSGLHESTVA